MSIGYILRKLRTSKKYSQQYVAAFLNISRNAYMAWENGQTSINYDKLRRIADLYGISIQEILVKK